MLALSLSRIPACARLFVSCATGALLIGHAASAATVTWSGGTGNWNTPAQWNGGNVPFAADDAVVDGETGTPSVVTVTANATINNLTISTGDSVSVNNNRTFTLNGDLSNDGTFALASGRNFTTLTLGGNTAFNGTGVLTLSNSAANRITGTAFGNVLTNSAGHTIRGSGNIGLGVLGLANAGVIEAVGGAGLTLQLNAGAGVTRENTGTLRATGGGKLTISQGAIDNTAGVIEADTGGTVSFTGAGTRIDGGTLTGDGDFDLRGGATLADVQNDSDISIANTQFVNIAGTIVNNGTFALNSVGNGTRLTLIGDTTLDGTGVLTLSDSTANQVTGTAFGNVLTNSAGHTITGSGNIGLNVLGLANAGLIEAVGGAGLTLQLNAGAGVTRENTGTLRAATGGKLTISQGVIDNATGVIEADTGGTVSFTGAGTRIDGGVLTGGGAFDLRKSSTLADVQNDSAVSIANGQAGRIAGTIVNDGTFALNSTGSGTRLTLIGDTTLDGTGVLTLSDKALNQITGTALGVLLTNSAGHTIRGSGNIGFNGLGLANAGLIEADGTVALTIDPATGQTVLNTGTMRASGAGGLSLTSGSFDNQGLIEAVGGSTVSTTTSGVTLNNDGSGTLTGGQWRAAGASSTIDIRGGQVETNDAEIILSGAGSRFRAFQGATAVALEDSLTTNSHILRVLDGRDFTAANGITNFGAIELGGGTLDAPMLENTAEGEIFGFGAITPNVGNSGTVRATGGTLTVSDGITAASGTVISEAGATVALGADSSAEFLDLQGGSLALGGHDFTVSGDYTNTAFGVGNAFDRRANVTGSGQIIGENAGLGTGGDVVAGVLDLGNVRGGTSVTKSFTVVNAGTGADIRGALQTAAGAGNITDGRLSGSGVTAQNFGPIAAGDSARSG